MRPFMFKGCFFAKFSLAAITVVDSSCGRKRTCCPLRNSFRAISVLMNNILDSVWPNSLKEASSVDAVAGDTTIRLQV